MTIDDFFNKISTLLREDKVDSALDFLFENTHNNLRNGDFNFCELVFGDKRLREIDPQIGVSFLAISLPWKNSIKNRITYISDLKDILDKTVLKEEREYYKI